MSPKLQLPTTKNQHAATSPSYFQKIVAEFLGTYVLIFVGCASALVDQTQKLTIVGIAIVWGVVLMVMIYAVGHVSGAHFNPAVTIGLAASRKLQLKLVPLYIFSQLLGAVLACLTLRVLFHDHDTFKVTMTQYKDSTSDLEAVIWEFITSFILMFTICGVATDHRASKDFHGVAIGGALLLDVMLAGPITGASMNPARSIAPAVVNGIYKNLWVFIVAPILGAVTAALLYLVLQVPKQVESEENVKNLYNNVYVHAEP